MTKLQRVLREPILHFLLLGGLLFAFYAAIAEPEPEGAEARSLAVTADDVTQLAQQFEQTWRRPPTQDEMQGLIRALVREEVLVQEALALSMDVDDPVIRRRLAQKMEFLIESAASATPPTEAELRAFHAENQTNYARPAQVAFEQVYLGQSPTEAEAAAALAALQTGADHTALGQRTLLSATIGLSPRQAIDGVFGTGLFDALLTADTGVWTGPVPSGYGLHLVRVTEISEAAPLDFDAARDKVEADWRAATSARMLEAVFAEMQARYEIETPSVEDIDEVLN